MFEIFNYLLGVLSIIVGLGLTTALDALGNVIKYRANIKIYWVALLWEIGVLLMLLQHWFGIWEFQTAQAWNFPMFLLFLLPATSLYLTSYLAFPKITENTKYDMKDYYFDNQKFFFSAAAAYFIFDGISSSLIRDAGQWNNLDNAFRIVGVVIVYISANNKKHRTHAIISILALAALIAYIFLFSSTPLVSLL